MKKEKLIHSKVNDRYPKQSLHNTNRTRMRASNKLMSIMITFVLLFGCCSFTFYYFFHDSQPSTTDLLVYDDKDYIHVQYPHTSSNQLNQYLTHFVNTTIDQFQSQKQASVLKASTNQNPPELSVDYDMTSFNHRYLSIQFNIYTYFDTATRKEVYINYDSKEKRFFTLDEIIDIKSFVNYLQGIGIQADERDLSMTNFYITEEGCIIVHDEGQTVLAYDVLEPYLKVGIDVDKDISDFPIELIPPNERLLSDKPMVAITFDDGPSTRYTPQILEVLNKYNARATFFVIGRKIPLYTDLLTSIIQQGNEIGNHTYNHLRLTSLTQAETVSQIEKTQLAAKEYLNYDIKIIRPPYGTISPASKQISALPQIKWTLDTRDWESKNTNSIIKKVMKQVKPNDIILFHDIYKSTALAIEEIVPMLIEDGYQLVTVSELLKAMEKAKKTNKEADY